MERIAKYLRLNNDSRLVIFFLIPSQNDNDITWEMAGGWQTYAGGGNKPLASKHVSHCFMTNYSWRSFILTFYNQTLDIQTDNPNGPCLWVILNFSQIIWGKLPNVMPVINTYLLSIEIGVTPEGGSGAGERKHGQWDGDWYINSNLLTKKKQYINQRLRGQLRLPFCAVMFSASHISDTLTPWWQLRQQLTRQTQMHFCLPQKAVYFPHVARHHVGETVCKCYTLPLHVSLPALNVNLEISAYKCSSNLSSACWDFNVNVAINVPK